MQLFGLATMFSLSLQFYCGLVGFRTEQPKIYNLTDRSYLPGGATKKTVAGGISALKTAGGNTYLYSAGAMDRPCESLNTE